MQQRPWASRVPCRAAAAGLREVEGVKGQDTRLNLVSRSPQKVQTEPSSGSVKQLRVSDCNCKTQGVS